MERFPMNEFGEPNMGNPSVRFDEGRKSVGHWPLCLSTHPLPPTLRNGEEEKGKIIKGIANLRFEISKRKILRMLSANPESVRDGLRELELISKALRGKLLKQFWRAFEVRHRAEAAVLMRIRSCFWSNRFQGWGISLNAIPRVETVRAGLATAERCNPGLPNVGLAYVEPALGFLEMSTKTKAVIPTREFQPRMNTDKHGFNRGHG